MLYIYDVDRLHQTMLRIPDAHEAGLCSLGFDAELGLILTGGFDGAFKVRCVQGYPFVFLIFGGLWQVCCAEGRWRLLTRLMVV